MNIKTTLGNPLPLGATVMADGINFAIYSHHGTAAFLELFDSQDDNTPAVRIQLDPKRNRTGDIWHIFVEGAGEGMLYGWRIDGPYRPLQGHRFNVHKLLVDPFARAMIGAFDMFNPALYGYDRGSSLKDRSFSTSDSAASTVRCVAAASAPMDWDCPQRPDYELAESIIYECHVKGMTAHPSSMAGQAGTFAALKTRIPHLKKLGVTSIELLPVAQYNTLEPPTLVDPETGKHLQNYWGYATIGFFSPHNGYAANPAPGHVIQEFRDMVRAFHEAQIEVILDVVFNHSGEGNEHGPTIAFRGLDNATYYMIDDSGKYANYTGCGNTMNCNHPVMKHLIIECLRYWMIEMHVDGFRFDLATILGRSHRGEWINDPNLGLLSDIASDPVLSGCKLIAEAWDAAGLYKVGNFPSGWAEWNGKFRDDVRRFWLMYDWTALDLARRIGGSKDLFGGKQDTTHSINFITAHDGFTLRDLCSYKLKHNERNGERNCDGSNDNISDNFGIEGETDDPAIIRRRLQHAKNLIATLILSRGTPMILGGDEIWRTQCGNNNGFCQDSLISWIDWTETDQSREMMRFFTKLIELRRTYTALRKVGFADPLHSRPRIDSLRFHGIHLEQPDFSACSHTLAFELIDGQSAPRFYVAMNAWKEALSFDLPRRPWLDIIDTSRLAPEDFVDPDNAQRYPSMRLTVPPNTLRVLISAAVR